MNKENQVAFFKMIQKTLPGNINMAHVISGLLGIGINAAYIRIRGSKLLDFEETIRLCRHFGVSMDSFIGNANINNRIQVDYTPLYGNEKEFYSIFLHELSLKLGHYVTKPGINITILASGDIPAFGMSMFPDAALFRHFSWCNLFDGITDYEKFVNETLTDEILNDYNSIAKNYQQIPSTEIWSHNTIDTILQFVSYHYEMGHFGKNKSALLLCNRLMELIGKLERWATIGTKGDDGAPFKLYLSEIDVANTFIFYKTDGEQECWLKLFTTHGMAFTDKFFCREVNGWLQRSLDRAILISKASSIERYKFFDSQRQKIEALAKRIKG